MIICLILLYRTSSPDSYIDKTMMIVTIILGITIGFVLFGLGYLTASMVFMSKHTDEIDKIDVLNNQVKENESIKLNRNKTRNDNNKNNKEGISDMR